MKMKLKNILSVVAISAVTAILSVWGYGKWMQSQSPSVISQPDGKLPVNYAGFFDKNNVPAGPVDFSAASTFLITRWSAYGPFLIERPIIFSS